MAPRTRASRSADVDVKKGTKVPDQTQGKNSRGRSKEVDNQPKDASGKVPGEDNTTVLAPQTADGKDERPVVTDVRRAGSRARSGSVAVTSPFKQVKKASKAPKEEEDAVEEAEDAADSDDSEDSPLVNLKTKKQAVGRSAKRGSAVASKAAKGKQPAAPEPMELDSHSSSDSDFAPEEAESSSESAAESSSEEAESAEEVEEEEEEALSSESEQEEEAAPAAKRRKTQAGKPPRAPAARRGGGRGQAQAEGAGGRQRGGGRGGAAPRRGRKKAEDADAAAAKAAQEAEDNAVWDKWEEEVDPESLVRSTVNEQMEPAPEVLLSLLPYQKEFLAWGIKQEQSEIRGGILADEMGLGKTIQAISLIATHRNDDLRPTDRVFDTTRAAEAEPSQKRLGLKLAQAPPAARAASSTLPAGASSAAPDACGCDESHEPGECPEEQPGTSGGMGARKASAQGSSVLPEALVPSPIAASGEAAEAVANVPHLGHVRAADTCGEACGVGCGAGPSSSAGPPDFCGATLVICPLVAVIQWRQEIARYVAPGALKVVVYHGSKRACDAAELAAADVVLTTYSIIEGEYRRTMLPGKATCTYCGRKFYPERLKVHLRYFCGPHAKKSAKQALQQKKRARAWSKQRGKSKTAAAAGSDSEEEDEESSEEDEEDLKGKGKAAAKGKGKAAGKGKGKSPRGGAGSSKATSSKAAGEGKEPAGKGKGKAAASKGKGKKVESDDDDEDDDYEVEAEEEDEEQEEIDVEVEGDFEDAADRAAAQMMAAAAAAAKPRPGSAAAGGEAGPLVSLLHAVRWRRIVLDEAHSIKDRRSSTARAVFALTSKYKWALSGTPLQNRVAELYSLVRFLRIFPYAYYFCNRAIGKGGQRCGCSSLDYTFQGSRTCKICQHSPLSHYCWWNRYVANPIKAHGYQGRGRAAMRLLKHQVLAGILLRRTKLQCADMLTLPPRTIVLRKDRFDERELDFYEALYTQSQAQFSSYVQSGTVLNNYAHIFDLLIRLRQAVDHPYLVVHSTTGNNAAAGAAASAAAASAPPPEAPPEGECGICHDPVEDPCGAACGHLFCRLCVVDFLDAATGTARCPTCRQPLTVDLSATAKVRDYAPVLAGAKKDSILTRMNLASFQSSSKIEALREEIDRMIARDPSAKAIVFSQFTSMLDLIAFRLHQVGVKCVRLQGSMSMPQRTAVIDQFTHDPDVRVFLMSLKAGGVALNLTAASHVMLMDIWWNPAVEDQAASRMHRIGQYKPVHITRFVIANTIEERILKLQEKKLLIFEGTVGQDAEALGRLTEDDMRFLFG